MCWGLEIKGSIPVLKLFTGQKVESPSVLGEDLENSCSVVCVRGSGPAAKRMGYHHLVKASGKRRPDASGMARGRSDPQRVPGFGGPGAA